MKPIVFIGSSVEALEVARTIQEELEHDAFCKIWTQGIFKLSGNTLDNLLDATKDCDFAIFIFQPDDILHMREEKILAVRDNVIFEIGLFFGALGKERVFYLVPKGTDKIHLPTDLLGITPGHYEKPDRDADLQAALGPFCQKVRRQCNNLGPINPKEDKSENKVQPTKNKEGESVQLPQVETSIRIKNDENGVKVDEFGIHTISISPTVFWYNRICDAFPGERGLAWFNDEKDCLKRIGRLLRNPTYFENCVGEGITCDPIWWWRESSALPIKKYQELDDGRCLIDIQELHIGKIAVFHSAAYWACFVYVETMPDTPTELYPRDPETTQRHLDNFGYEYEEFALFQGHKITRACYDDAAAVIDGELTDISGAQLRSRFISKYNFIIASKYSPINSSQFEIESQGLLTGMLNGAENIDRLCDLVEKLPRHRNDY